MSAFLTDLQYTPAEIAKMAGELMGQPVTSAEPVSKGANSRVYRLRSSLGNYVMKFYFQHPKDTRDRLGTEFRSMSFLWAQGIRQVPQPLNAWDKHACAVYTLVEGVSPLGQILDADFDQAIDFLKILKGLTKSIASKEFAPASEAFFCAKDIVNSLKARLKRFNFDDTADEYLALRKYLQNEFIPLLEDVELWSKEYLAGQGVLWEQELLDQYRTLSPADFGFHNALRTPAGRMVFLDFEYFGWDDPVKLVADFVWHPAMSLTQAQKEKFMHQMQSFFDDDPQFRTRLKAFFPLFGLKWCLIFLNEFVAVDMQRRGFAGMVAQDKTAVRLKQLAKAKAMSDQVRCCYKEFPYGKK
ncbi:MAG: aminoglycoside phosphotransferase family protein [Candidatus Omnitrophica bacterium]|nr:aminoglycoside phosphotransferase family protein [Candidatus Omnitrophota bacterium]